MPIKPPPKFTPVILETPYAGDVEYNLKYARACVADCIRRHEAPFASHLIYTQDGVLDDNDPNERMLGIHAGFAWRARAEYTVAYIDHGISRGMMFGIKDSIERGRWVDYRSLYGVVIVADSPPDPDGTIHRTVSVRYDVPHQDRPHPVK